MTGKYTKSGALDRRFRVNKTFEVREYEFTQKYLKWIGVWVLLVIAFLILIKTVSDANKPLVSPKGSGAVKTIEVKAAEPERYCGDPISYIRCSGEALGKSNQEIQTMIKIAKCESGLRADAINKNRNGTFDMGVLQINDVHSKRISRQDRLDFRKNIDFGWKLQTEQGFRPWVCYQKI